MSRLAIYRYVILSVLSIFFALSQAFSIYAQTTASKKIHVIRERKFLGCGNKMDIEINGESVFKLKNGRHLIIISHHRDSLDFQIIYPVMKKYKSNHIHFKNENETEIYLLVSYSGTGKSFRIEMKQLTIEEGVEYLINANRYNKKTTEIEI